MTQANNTDKRSSACECSEDFKQAEHTGIDKTEILGDRLHILPSEDSPLRNLPSQLNPHQSLFLDGIRYAIEMADIAYRRLVEELLLKTNKVHSGDEGKGIPHAFMFLDAWSFIDSVHRLRELLEQMPGIQKNESTALKVFLGKTALIEDLRHIAQHLRREVKELADCHASDGIGKGERVS